MSLVRFYRPILTLSMRAFGPRNSAYAFWTTTDIPTDRPTYIYHAKSRLNTPVWGSLRSPNYIPPPLTVHFSMTRSVRYQPIFNTLYYTLHTEHAYCLSYRFLNTLPSLKWLNWLKYSTEDLVSVQLSE